MTFRPSVLPDRDNDILSTFTRSFERGRTLARQDAADRRADLEFQQRQEDREEARASRILDFRLRAAQDPGASIVDTEDEDMLRLQQALQGQTPTLPGIGGREIQIPGQEATDIEGGGMIPALPGRTLRVGGTGPQRINIPRDVLDPSTPVLDPDAQIVGRAPGGGTVTVSETMRNRILRERGRAEREQDVIDRNTLSPIQTGELDGLRAMFEDELGALPDTMETLGFGRMLLAQQRSPGLSGATDARARERAIQGLIDDRVQEQFGDAGAPDTPAGRALLSRFREEAEAQIDAEAGQAGTGTTEQLAEEAAASLITPEERENLTLFAQGIVPDLMADAGNLSAVVSELEGLPATRKRIIEPQIRELIQQAWDDPRAPWSDPANRPGVGGTVFGGRPGEAIFRNAESVDDIVDIIFGR